MKHVFSSTGAKPKIIMSIAIALALALALVTGFSSHLFASAHGPGKTYHYAPLHIAGDPDSGTCGNSWATDTFNVVFTINSNNPDTITATFQNAKFVTVAGASPGACQLMPGPNGNGNTVGAGVHGTFQGHEIIVVSNGTFNSKAKCTQKTCAVANSFSGTIAKFISVVYGASATSNTTSYDTEYYTAENGSWEDSSADQGGNRGDITGPAGAPR